MAILILMWPAGTEFTGFYCFYKVQSVVDRLRLQNANLLFSGDPVAIP